jgi:CRISPR-associated protein Csd2
LPFKDSGRDLGNAHAHALFERTRARKKVDVPRNFSDCEVTVDDAGLPDAVNLIRRVG